MSFSGITTALVTPFSNGHLDKESFLNLLKIQTQEGIRQFVLASTTGENPTLEEKEVDQLCLWFKDFEAKAQIPLKLILAVGTSSTKTTLEKTKKAVDRGAQGILVVTPYYNKPSQKGMILHFEKTARQSEIPMILYNVPSRTACSLTAESIKTLSEIDNILGIKEATGDISFLKEIKQLCSKDFLLLSGDDLSCAEFFNEGGQGAISAGANVLAKELIHLLNSKPEERIKKFKNYKAFLEELFQETNPIGVKQVLKEKGVISSSELRLPLLFIKTPQLSKELNSLQNQ